MIPITADPRSRARRRQSVAALVMALLVCVAAPIHAHDEYRFVGTVVKYDRIKERLEMTARETDEQGKVKEFTVRMSVPEDVQVTRALKKVSRSELKPGVFVIVDAAGVEMIEIDAVAIQIVELPKPAKPAASKPGPATTKKP